VSDAVNAIFAEAQRAVIAGDAGALDRLLREHEPFIREHAPPAYRPAGPGPTYTRGDAEAIIAREHFFESWAAFVDHRSAMQQPDSAVARFETAVEAVIDGDVAALQRALHVDPGLIRRRSTRTHHSTLLHYVGANGVEGFRQKTPPNAVDVLRLLLDAGADVDSMADMYGGSTTLGLVATSIHPLRAGVQIPLLELLIERGATIDVGGRGRGDVVSCLANGRARAAEFLASKGAHLTLEGAAGVGRLDIVRTFFREDGSLDPAVPRQELIDGFTWACEFGKTAVADFLLQHGVAVTERLKHHGQTGLHWAAFGAHLDTVNLLLERGSPVNERDREFDGTPLGWALYAWGNEDEAAKREKYYDVVARLVAAGATVEPEWLGDSSRDTPLPDLIRADAQMRDALADGPGKAGG
jgi:ankyrin repeat protein